MEAGLIDALMEVEALRAPELLGALGLAFARYLPPEGWHVPRHHGPAGDIFALGLVLLEVLDGSGIPNPECKSLQQLSAKMLPKRGQWQPQVRRGSSYEELPVKTRRSIEKCFCPDPEKRPSAQELLFSLAAPDSKEDVDESWYSKPTAGVLSFDGGVVSDGMKSDSTGTGSARSQDFDMDLSADLAEEPILKTLTQAPRHMSWPSGRVPDVPDRLCPAEEFHFDDARGASPPPQEEERKPLPPPPPCPKTPLRPTPREGRCGREGRPRARDASPKSPGRPLPPPPPLPDFRKPRNAAPPPMRPASPTSSRPPSPPRPR